MDPYPLESELLFELDRCDELVRLCAAGQLSFADFCTSYDNFYWSYALDGHESDSTGLAILTKHADRIAPHQVVAETVLSYRSAGSVGAEEAVDKLKLVAAGLPGREA